MTPAALAALALAVGGIPVSVGVGETLELDVGNAIGWYCDDPIIAADIVTRGGSNVWIVTGMTPGTTQCRVGTSFSRARFLFDVTVTSEEG